VSDDKRSSDDVEPQFFDETNQGGWWAHEGGEPQLEKRATPRVAYRAVLRLVPAEGASYDCESCNLSLGGILLSLADLRPLPQVGQLVELEVLAGAGTVVIGGEVVRHTNEAEAGDFAVRFIELGASEREQLSRIVKEQQADPLASDVTSYSWKKGDPG